MLTEDGQRWLEERRRARAQPDTDSYADAPPPDEPPPDEPPPDEPPTVVDIGRARKDQPRRDDQPEDKGPKVWAALELQPAAQPRWLAANRLPRAAVSLLIGDEGIGKSLLWVLVVAHITRGTAFPGFGIPARDPGRVMLVTTEDDWSTAVRPRLEVAGADLSMISVICWEKDGSGAPSFPKDLPLIRHADPKPDLVIVDCWLDTVPAALSVRDPQEARLALHPWKDVATTTDAAIWLLAHSNRVGTGSMRDRYGATYVLRQKARMTIYAMEDDDGALLAGPDKTNGAITTVASRFTLTPILKFEPNLEHDGTVPLLEYKEFSELRIREHVEAAAAHNGTTHGDSSDAIAWLALQLAGGPRWSADIKTAAECDKISKRKLDRAKLKLNVEAAREAGNGPWFWLLPQHSGWLPGAQNHAQNPMFSKRDCGDSGENSETHTEQQKHSQSHSEVYIGPEEPADGRCDCGAQLTTPASIRYGECYECRTIASKDDDEPPF
jgi:hypothetical protein